MSRDQALSGEGMSKGWADKLLDVGYSAADIVDGSSATVWAYCYGHNSGVPQCAHHGHYVIYVPAQMRQDLHFEDDGDSTTAGDLVEIKLVQTSNGQIVGELVSVYRSADDWRDCRVESLTRGSLSTAISILGGVGPPRAIWLECESAVADGWLRRPVRGAPLSDQLPVSEWIKLPAM